MGALKSPKNVIITKWYNNYIGTGIDEILNILINCNIIYTYIYLQQYYSKSVNLTTHTCKVNMFITMLLNLLIIIILF